MTECRLSLELQFQNFGTMPMSGPFSLHFNVNSFGLGPVTPNLALGPIAPGGTSVVYYYSFKIGMEGKISMGWEDRLILFFDGVVFFGVFCITCPSGQGSSSLLSNSCRL